MLELVFTAVFVILSQSAECEWDSGTEITISSAGFDTAVRRSQSPVTLNLVEDTQLFGLLSPLEVNHCLAIRGNQQTLILGQRVTVAQELRISNATLKSAKVDLEALVDVRGTMVVQYCIVEGFSVPLFQVFGRLQVLRSTVSQSSEVIIKIFAESDISLAEVEVEGHVGAFLDCHSRLEAGVQVDISACTFRNSTLRGTESLLTLVGASGTLSLALSQFIHNSIPLLYFDVSSFKAAIVSCAFSVNSGTNIAGYVRASQLKAQYCSWSDNSGILIDMKRLSGNFTFANCAMSRQTENGVIQIYGSSTADCQCAIVDSRFSDSAVVVNGTTSGALLLSYCSGLVSNTSIVDFIVTASEFRQVKGLFAFQFSSFVATNLQLSRSGSTDACLIGAFSSVRISNATFHRSHSGQNLIIGLSGGDVFIDNLTFVDTETVHKERLAPGFQMSALIALISVVGSVTDVQVIHTESGHYELPVVLSYSTINITRFGLRHVNITTFLTLQSSSVAARDVELADSSVCGALVYLQQHSKALIANFTVSRSSLHCLPVLWLTNGCYLAANNLSFSEVAAEQLIGAKASSFVGRSIGISRSKLLFLVLHSYGSQFEFEGMSVRQTETGLLDLVESSVALANCEFQEVTGKTNFFQVQLSSVAVLNCTFRSIFSLEELGKFYENSSLTIANSSFRGLESIDGEGFRVTDGTLNILNSQFAQYSAALFQAVSSTVTIHDSSFKDGVNLVQAQTSNTAYGGVLGCASCSAVDIKRINVFNVTADSGGAVAVRFTDTTRSSKVFIEGSEFLYCSAKTGGAVYIRNSPFSLENSYFAGNSAQGHGGALFVDIRAIVSNSVTNCTFEVNSACEGGAIKWRNAPVHTKKCRYVNNSAHYGSDIASYGVELSSSLTNVSQVYVSGSKLTITFELLDHYGNRVKTATNQYLSLLSTNVHYRGNSVSFINEGIFHFPELTVYALPNSTQTITGEMNDTQGDFRIHAIGTVKLTFRDCEAGEIRRDDRCEYCYSGTVSYSPLDSNCTYCPPNAFCPGGPHLVLNSGFWRSSMNTTTLLRCPLEDNCEGSEYSNCAEGYTGLLCNQCADSFYRFRTVECESCLHIAAVWVQVLIPIALIALFAYLLIRYSHRSKESEQFILKTSIHHTQFLAAMCPLKVSLPPILKNSLHALTYVSSLQISDLPLACFRLTSPELVRALIASLLLPALVVVSFIVNYLLKIEWKKRTFVFSSTLLLFTPPIVVDSAISLLVCQSVDSSEEWLFLDMSQQCWTNSHKLIIFALVTPSLILNTIVPMAAVILTALLRPAIFDEYFPVWRSGYRCRCWDLLLVVSKAVCYGLLTISISGSKLSQLTYGLLVFIVVSVVNVSSVDLVYSTHRFFYVAETSLVVASVSMGLCTPYTYSTPGPAARDYFLSAVFLLLNCGFFAICIMLSALVLLKTEKTERRMEISPPHNSIASSEQSFAISS